MMRALLGLLLCCIGWHRARYDDTPRLIHTVTRYRCERCGATLYDSQ
jgi:hypothetical protein